MKIGFYSPYLDTFGGGERYMLTLASYLSKSHSVDIFWNDQTIKAPLTRFLKIDLSQLNFTFNIFSQNLASKLYKTSKYDLIFVLSDGSIPTTFCTKNILHFQVPFKFKKLSSLNRLKLLKYQHVVANSYFTKSFIDKSYGVNSVVIYPPVDLRYLKRSKKENIILSVGRFSSNQLHPKKQEILIDVFKEVYKKAPDWRLFLAGQVKKSDQKYLRTLKKICRGLAINIIENLPNEDLINLYARSSIYWHATGFGEDENSHPERMEHFGIATVEASAAGCVPIVISKGGQKEIVEEGKTGLLWETKTQLFNQTTRLIKDKMLMKKLSQNAVKNSRRFSKENFIKAYEKVIFA